MKTADSVWLLSVLDRILVAVFSVCFFERACRLELCCSMSLFVCLLVSLCSFVVYIVVAVCLCFFFVCLLIGSL